MKTLQSGLAIILLCSFCAATLPGCTLFPTKTQQVWRSLTEHDYPSDPVGTPAFEAALDLYTGSVALPVGERRLLQNGGQAYPAMLELINNAENTISFETYIIEDDRTTDEFFEALKAAAERGVKVRVLVDAAGFHRSFIAQLNELSEYGVEGRVFNPFFLSWTLVRGNNRDHRKILVADGCRAVLGGINLSDTQQGDGKTGWRDTSLLVTGPGAAAAERVFEQSWQQGGRGWLGKDIPIVTLNPVKRRLDAPFLRAADAAREPPTATDGAATVRVVASSPGTVNSPTYDLAILSVLGARERLDIASAYFVPPLNLRRALLAAAERGVRVRLLLPQVTDVKLVREMGMRFYDEFLEAGIEIYEWPYAILHAKTLVADGKWLVVGSANMDSRSYFLNYEANLALSDSVLAEEAHAQFERDIRDAQALTLETWRARSMIQRLKETVLIPLAGQF